MQTPLKLGIVGFDTSHVLAFTKLLHNADDAHHVPGAKIVAGYPTFSADLASSADRVEGAVKFAEERLQHKVGLDQAARIAKTLDFVASLDAGQFAGSDAREIVLRPGTDKEKRYDGQTYLLNYAIPQFMFHVTTAYAILRHAGVDVGKVSNIGFDPKAGTANLAHCYGYVGVGRDVSPDTGTGGELYAVIGHAPRHLDRNIALVGRVISGVERMSSLPRGTGTLGFYEQRSQDVGIASVQLASEMPAAKRPSFQHLDTNSPAFSDYIRARANRKDDFFIRPAGGVDLCNVNVPVRFDTDHMAVTIETYQLHNWQQIPIVHVEAGLRSDTVTDGQVLPAEHAAAHAELMQAAVRA